MTEIAPVTPPKMGKWINNSSLLVTMDPFTLFWGVIEAISVIFLVFLVTIMTIRFTNAIDD